MSCRAFLPNKWCHSKLGVLSEHESWAVTSLHCFHLGLKYGPSTLIQLVPHILKIWCRETSILHTYISCRERMDCRKQYKKTHTPKEGAFLLQSHCVDFVWFIVNARGRHGWKCQNVPLGSSQSPIVVVSRVLLLSWGVVVEEPKDFNCKGLGWEPSYIRVVKQS